MLSPIGLRYGHRVGAVDPLFTTAREVPGAVRALLVCPVRSDATGGRVVVFFAGFMVSPWSYRSFFGAIIAGGTSIVAPQMYRRGPGPLIGHPSAAEEAEQAIRVVEHVVATRRPDEVWLMGHSRGAQVAWRVAEAVDPVGVVAIDPVDGAGRRPTALAAAAQPASFASRTLVIGAGIGGSCAPDAVSHRHFAAAAPPGSSHTVVASMGHGDVLDDRPARASRVICGGSDDPRRERAMVADLVRSFVERIPV